MAASKNAEHRLSNLTNLKLEAKYYSRPAFITTEQPESYKCGAAEKKLGKICKNSDRSMFTDQTVQKRLKGRVMGIKLLRKIVAKGQRPVAIRVISFLGWLDFALLLTLAGSECPELICLSRTLLQKILVDNTPLNVNFVGEQRERRGGREGGGCFAEQKLFNSSWSILLFF